VTQRLGRLGARACLVPDDTVARAILPERHWDALLVDRALGLEQAAALAREARTVPQRIVLLTPAERNELATLREAGFTGYLIKPVRSASLIARLRQGGTISDADLSVEEDREASAPKGLSVLVAEDNDINALLARALLARLGHRATLAQTGTVALESYLAAESAGAPYDVILMDLHMPEMDGLETTRRIRAAEGASGAPRMPIIALTANAFSEDREACIAAGMDDFLVKPLDRERLADALAAVDGKSRLAA
jgi:CheY-like chemotaxis protein